MPSFEFHIDIDQLNMEQDCFYVDGNCMASFHSYCQEQDIQGEVMRVCKLHKQF